MKTKTKKILLFFFLLQFSVINSFAQPWYITPGNTNTDMSWGVDADSSGNIWWVVNEVVPPSSYYDIYIYKIDSSGQTLWKKKLYSTPYNDIAFIVKAKEPYLFIGGRIETDTSVESSDLLLLTCMMQGDTVALQWPYQWDGAGSRYEELDGIEMDASGIYITGFTSPDTVATHKDMVVQKLDFNGNILWDTVWVGTPNGFEGANGHIAIDGTAIYIASHYDVFPGQASLISFDKNNGNILWNSLWGGGLYDDFYGLTMSADSFIYAIGRADGWISTGQLALVKYTRTGLKIWERKWGGTDSELSRAIVADGDSIIYIAGNTWSYGVGKSDIVLLKYDSAGNFLDSAIWGTQQYDQVRDITMFGNYLYLVGTIDTAASDFTASPEANSFLLKVDKRTFLFTDTIPDIFINVVDFQGNENIEVEVYPNPSSGKFIIDLGNGKGQMENGVIEIYNVLGERIYSTNLKQQTSNEIDLSNYSKGIYFVKIYDGTNTYTKKIVVQ